MNSRKPASSLKPRLFRQHRTVLGFLAARLSLRAAAAAAFVITLAVLIGLFAVRGETSAWGRLAAVLIAAVGCIGWAVRKYLKSAIGFDGYLESIETRFPAVRSRLRNALDFENDPEPDTSFELKRAVGDDAARHLERLPLATLRPGLAPRSPLLALAASAAVIVGLGLVAPAQVSRSWATLWNPALAAPAARLVVEPGSVTVSPGAALAVRARVWGTPRTPALALSGGRAPAPADEGIGPEGERLWRFDLTQLTSDHDYRVRVARLESPRYRISLTGEPAAASFEIEYRAPAYARLPIQRGAATRGDLSALRGTRARVEVTFDRDLESLAAVLPGGATSSWTEVTARRWRGEVPIDRNGEYELRAQAASGAARFRYRIQSLDDAPPVLAVRIPTGDLDLPTGQQVPVDVTGQDDLGLSELRLQYRKDPAAPWATLPLARFGARPREASVQSRWDASSLALLPGEIATFRFELLDDNAVSGPGRAVSPTFELRFPSLGELYDHIDATQGHVQKTLEKVADQARELQKSLDKLARQPARQTSESTPAFERSEELKSSLERQQQIGQKIDEASQELRKSLENASERQAFNEELMRKMQQMAELMDQVQSKEFREALKRMQEALENLDRRQLEQNLPEWRQQNQEMMTQLERTIDLLKQLRQEEQLQALARKAEELKERQDALNQEHEKEPRGQKEERQAQEKALADRQEREAQETEKLAQEARTLAKEMEKPSEERTSEAAETLEKEAAPEQREASKSASQSKKAQARQSGQKASESLGKAASMLQEMAQEMEKERSGVDLAAVRRAAQDLVSLQREADSNLSSAAPLNQRADRQTDLSEGASRVADSLYALAKQSPFISPKLGETLGKAISGLANSGREMGSGNRARGEESGRGGNAALNDAVLQLRKTEQSMCDMSGAMNGKKPGSMPQRMGELGERQSQLNRQSKDLAQRLTQQMRLSAGDRDQLERLAQEQQRLREQLEQIQRDDETRRELLGKLEGAKRDMQDAEEELRSGASSGDLEQIQQRILSRLLDAQRSVNRRDFDPERESRSAADVIRASAPELPADLLRESDRLRLDLLKAEADRYPAQYRAFVEAYLRALNGSRR